MRRSRRSVAHPVCRVGFGFGFGYGLRLKFGFRLGFGRERSEEKGEQACKRDAYPQYVAIDIDLQRARVCQELGV